MWKDNKNTFFKRRMLRPNLSNAVVTCEKFRFPSHHGGLYIRKPAKSGERLSLRGEYQHDRTNSNVMRLVLRVGQVSMFKWVHILSQPHEAVFMTSWFKWTKLKVCVSERRSGVKGEGKDMWRKATWNPFLMIRSSSVGGIFPRIFTLDPADLWCQLT